MSRRKHRGEIEFGSDSFLDVVANLVGILIILIVIAGLRVSRTPQVKEPDQPVEVTAEDLKAISSPMPDLPELVEGTSSDVQIAVLEPADTPVTLEEKLEEVPEEPEPEEVLPPLPPLVVPQELVDLAKKLESEIAELQGQESGLDQKLKDAGNKHETLLEQQQKIQKMLAAKSHELKDAKKRAAVIERDIELARQTLERLKQQVDEVESIPAHVETLEHKITPISRVVNGKEKHYRLDKNQIAEVPIDELIESFREQIDRRKDWLIKAKQHRGQAGPIRGFTMSYYVRVEPMSDMDALRSGHGGYRINLANWEVQPDVDLVAEGEDLALKRGSRFYQSLLGASPDTTLTFWVYPDSYSLYRKVQRFAHDQGFSVAGRPMPKGMPIAGSPNGSKSASQ